MLYFESCKECEYLYHCFGPETAEKIQNDKVELRDENCSSYYPLVKA